MSRFTHGSIVRQVIDIPAELAASQAEYNGERGRAFIAALPHLAADFLNRWRLHPDGQPMHGVCALVLPVTRDADGTPAVLKLQLLDEESAGEPLALRAWHGDGAVRLLDHDEPTGTLLLERLNPARTLAHRPVHEAVEVMAGLLAHLHATPAPPGLRTLGAVTQGMLDQTPHLLPHIPDPRTRRIVADCAAAVREVAGDPGDRLLHWDLHDENVLAADRADWLAIDPKPLAGDPGFDLWPALDNRYDPDDVLWRFDAMTAVMGLDRDRARAWTLGRVLQNALWDIEDGRPLDPAQLDLARRLRP